jgi:DNA-binding beta-propeller fold protein YncE
MNRLINPVAISILSLANTVAFGAGPLELSATIPMPSVKGRIDHLAVDVKGRRLFVAALGNDTVEVLDLAANRHLRSLSGFGEPQGIAYLPQANLIYVANGTANRVDVLDGKSYMPSKRIPDLDDADNVRFDAAAARVIVGYGKGALRILNADTAEAIGDIRLAGHPESFQLESAGARVFVNVPTAGHVAVVDRGKREPIKTWAVPAARANFPMALDEEAGRLFVAARLPAVLLVYATDSGKVVARVSIVGDADDLFFDVKRKRLYVIGGGGAVDILQQETPDRYASEASVKTAARARTGLFVPELDTLYVAAPADGPTPARVLVYKVK